MPDNENLQDQILQSETGKRMLTRVTPIYANSYIGLWMYEVIGREFDRVWDIVNSFAKQLFPDSATWAIELWERRYGLTPDPDQSLQMRRVNIEQKRHFRPPVSPYRLETIIQMLTGNPARVEDHVGPYTFGVWVQAPNQKVLKEVQEAINKIKPSHLSFDLTNYADAASSATIYTATGTASATIEIKARADIPTNIGG